MKLKQALASIANDAQIKIAKLFEDTASKADILEAYENTALLDVEVNLVTTTKRQVIIDVNFSEDLK